MEFINGPKDQDVCNDDKLDYYKLFMNFCIKCLMFDGYSHGDLHSGNILFIKDENEDCSGNILKLGILDCGIMNENTISERDIFHDYFNALRHNDAESLTTLSLTKLADPENRYEQFSSDVQNKIYDEILQIYKNICDNKHFISHHDISAINDILRRHGLYTSKIFMKLQVSLWLIQTVGLELMDGDIVKVFNYIKSILNDMFKPFDFEE